MASITLLGVVEWVLVPISLFFLVLLVLPFGGSFRRAINKFLASLLLLPAVGSIPLIFSIILPLGIFFLAKAHSLYNNIYLHKPEPNVPADTKHLYEIKRLRTERDFHIALVLLVFWALLYMILNLSKRLEASERIISALEVELDKQNQRTGKKKEQEDEEKKNAEPKLQDVAAPSSLAGTVAKSNEDKKMD